MDVVQCEYCSGNRKSDVGEAGVTDEAIERGGGLRLLAGDARGGPDSRDCFAESAQREEIDMEELRLRSG